MHDRVFFFIISICRKMGSVSLNIFCIVMNGYSVCLGVRLLLRSSRLSLVHADHFGAYVLSSFDQVNKCQKDLMDKSKRSVLS